VRAARNDVVRPCSTSCSRFLTASEWRGEIQTLQESLLNNLLHPFSRLLMSSRREPAGTLGHGGVLEDAIPKFADAVAGLG